MMASVFLSYLISMGLIFFRKYKISILFIFMSFLLTLLVFKFHMTDKLNLTF